MLGHGENTVSALVRLQIEGNTLPAAAPAARADRHQDSRQDPNSGAAARREAGDPAERDSSLVERPVGFAGKGVGRACQVVESSRASDPAADSMLRTSI